MIRIRIRPQAGYGYGGVRSVRAHRQEMREQRRDFARMRRMMRRSAPPLQLPSPLAMSYAGAGMLGGYGMLRSPLFLPPGAPYFGAASLFGPPMLGGSFAYMGPGGMMYSSLSSRTVGC